MPLLELLPDHPRERTPVAREHVLHETAAVEAGRIVAAQAVRRPLEREGSRGYRETVEVR